LVSGTVKLLHQSPYYAFELDLFWGWLPCRLPGQGPHDVANLQVVQKEMMHAFTLDGKISISKGQKGGGSRKKKKSEMRTCFESYLPT
jgi:hypothetical protein